MEITSQIRKDELSLKRIFLFWLPLASTWLMMSFEGPFLTAIIARMADPKFNLAAYGIAFSFALIIEAPVIMMMSAATALVRNKNSFIKLRNYIYALNLAITLLMIVFLIPPVFNFVAYDLINLPPEVARLTQISTLLLLPWPGAIGYRRFYQGVMIRNNQTRKVAYGTIIRVATIVISSILYKEFTDLSGAAVGAASLSTAVLAEAAASKFMARNTVKKLLNGESNINFDVSYSEITKFYYPLALTSLLSLGVHPLVTFFMGQSKFPIESLAVLPVVNSFAFIFKSFGLSLQEVIIALIGDEKEGYASLKKFSIILAAATFGSLAIIAFTPLSEIWFFKVAGLSETLADFAHIPLMILVITPALEVLINVQRAVLVDSRKTSPITTATAIEVFGIISILFLGIKFVPVAGAIIAATAFVIGRILANIYLIKPFLKISQTFGNRK